MTRLVQFMDTFRRLGAPTPISLDDGLSSNNNNNTLFAYIIISGFYFRQIILKSTIKLVTLYNKYLDTLTPMDRKSTIKLVTLYNKYLDTLTPMDRKSTI